MKIKQKLFVLLALTSGWVPTAFADHNVYHSWTQWWSNWWTNYWNSGGGGSGHSVPELDGSIGPMAIALIAGVIALGFERRRRKAGKRS